MRKMFLASLLMLILSACSGEREYKYVETAKDDYSTFDRTPVIIKAEADSDAVIKAFEKFCISHVLYENDRAKGGHDYKSKPLSFKIYNHKGEDITDIEFFTKEEQAKKVYDRITSKFLTAKSESADADESHKSESKTSNQSYSRVDSLKVKELMPYFNVKKDEFDPNGQTWFMPKSAPKYANRNAFYLYFGKSENNALPGLIRMKMQYVANNWLFINKVQFSIDGKPFEIIPSNVKRDNGGGQIWEWFDEPVRYKEFQDALENAKSVKIKFIGDSYHDIRTVSEKQLKDIKKSIGLYKAMGGV